MNLIHGYDSHKLKGARTEKGHRTPRKSPSERRGRWVRGRQPSRPVRDQGPTEDGTLTADETF